MKRLIAVFLAVVLTLTFAVIPAFARSDDDTACVAFSGTVFALRAGGGSSGGGSGGGSSGGGSSGSHRTNTGSTESDGNPFTFIISIIGFLLVGSATTVAFRLRLSKYARNTKKLMKMLQEKDSAWKYKHIQKQVKVTYFAVQKAWTNSDMHPAKQYMSDALYQTFQTQLSWMKYKDQRNVLKHIRLLEAVPVAVHDNQNDSLDFVWFYIKGRMIDYTVDIQTNQKLDGSPVPESFCEYWQFIRKEGNCWVLNQILQEDESDRIVFTEI